MTLPVGSRMLRVLGLAAMLLLTAGHPATALTIVHDEAVDGDASTDPAAPTVLALSAGPNRVEGSVQSLDDTFDFFTFTLSTGQALTGILLQRYEDLPGGGPGDLGFHAIRAGSTGLIPDFSNTGDFLGGNHLGPAPAGTDVLPGLAAATLSGTGFTVPLGPGTYTYHVQQTGPELTGYTLDLIVTPEPGTAVLLGLALLAAAATRRNA